MKQKKNVSALDKLGTAGIFLMVVVWVLGFGVYKYRTWEPDHSTHVQEVASTQKSTAPVKSVRKMETDLSLGGLDLDMTVDEVHKALGKENSAKKQGKYDFIYYDSLQVGTYQSVVRALVSDGSSVKTKRGIHEGSTFDEVKKAYGTDYYKMDNDDLTLYEYPFKSLKGHDGLLRFAIKKSDQTVKYISVRIPEDANPSEDDAKQAAKVLDGYYQGITSGHEREAYNLLTSARQKKMGTLEQFAKGFETTLSHRVSDLRVVGVEQGKIKVSYTLTARDSMANSTRTQVRDFDCQATLVKVNNDWRIDDMTAKKKNERFE